MEDCDSEPVGQSPPADEAQGDNPGGDSGSLLYCFMSLCHSQTFAAGDESERLASGDER